MRTLYLLRHATPLAGGSGERDFDRSLAPLAADEIRGAGHRIAASTAPRPTLVLCSAARRTVETLDQLRPHLPSEASALCEMELYGADRYGLLARLAEVDDTFDAVLVVAHNPGIAVLANALGTRGDSELQGRMARRFPPAALAILNLPIEHWAEAPESTGELIGFWTP